MKRVDLRAIKQPVQAWALVGIYLQAFAMLEWAVADLMAKLMNLTDTQSSILRTNMPFAQKVMTARTLSSFGIGDKVLAERAEKALKDLVDTHASERNFIAHTMFGAAENGVQFARVKAKKVFQQDMLHMTVEDIERKCRILLELDDEIRDITRKIVVDQGAIRAAFDVIEEDDLVSASLGLKNE